MYGQPDQAPDADVAYEIENPSEFEWLDDDELDAAEAAQIAAVTDDTPTESPELAELIAAQVDITECLEIGASLTAAKGRLRKALVAQHLAQLPPDATDTDRAKAKAEAEKQFEAEKHEIEIRKVNLRRQQAEAAAEAKAKAASARRYPETDDGNAQMWADRCSGTVKYAGDAGQWLIWTETVWVRTKFDGIPIQIAREAIRELENPEWSEASQSENHIQAAVNLGKRDPKIACSMDTFDQKGFEANTPGGIAALDHPPGLVAGDGIRPCDPASLHTRITGVAPDFSAGMPKFLKFLDQTFHNDDVIDSWLTDYRAANPAETDRWIADIIREKSPSQLFDLAIKYLTEHPELLPDVATNEAAEHPNIGYDLVLQWLTEQHRDGHLATVTSTQNYLLKQHPEQAVAYVTRYAVEYPEVALDLIREHLDTHPADHDRLVVQFSDWYVEQMTRFLQKAFGLTLIGRVIEHIFPMAIGDGGNGKGVLFELMLAIFGTYATTLDPTFLIETRDEPHPAQIADLQGIRFALASETKPGDRFNEPKIKRHTGGDTRKARFMGGNWFTYTPTDTIWLMTNYLAKVPSGGRSFWRRLLLIRFNNEPAVINPNLKQELLDEEGPAILAWVIEGARLYLAEGLQPPEFVRNDTAEYAEEEDHLADFVAEQLLVTGNRADKVNQTALYEKYTMFCRSRRKSAFDLGNLSRKLKKQFGIGTCRSNHVRSYVGVQTREQAQLAGYYQLQTRTHSQSPWDDVPGGIQLPLHSQFAGDWVDAEDPEGQGRPFHVSADGKHAELDWDGEGYTPYCHGKHYGKCETEIPNWNYSTMGQH